MHVSECPPVLKQVDVRDDQCIVYVSVSCARILCVFVEDTNSVLNTTEYVRIRIRERILTTVYPYCIQEKLYPYGIYTVSEK